MMKLLRSITTTYTTTTTTTSVHNTTTTTNNNDNTIIITIMRVPRNNIYMNYTARYACGYIA